MLLDAKNENNENLNKDNNQDGENNNTNTENNNPSNQGENQINTEGVSKETIDILTKEEKIYITPLINSLVIETLVEEKQIEIVSEINGWSYIKFGTTSGWVRTEKIQKKEVEINTSSPENNNNENNNTSSQKIGYISGTSVNFRKTPSTSAEIITKLTKNTKIIIITRDNEWAQVEYNGNTGYVSTDYISDKEIQTTSRSSSPADKKEIKEKEEPSVSSATQKVSTSEVTGSDIISYAKQYLGCKYTSGGSSPKSGFDCSGFTTYVYKHFGISLSRTSSGQNSNGVSVSRSNLAVGDIICFSGSSSSKRIGHVGIYVGGGKFIHSANSRQGVIISNVSGDGYYFVSARRIV